MKRRRRLAATLGLVVLVIVDIALVFAALRITGRSSAAETPSGDATSAPASSADRLTEHGSHHSPRRRRRQRPRRTNVPGVPLTVVLSAVDGSLAWRATVGSCGSGGAAVQITTDGGKTWRNRTSPYAVVTRIQATDATKGFVVGAAQRVLDGRAHDHRRGRDLARDRRSDRHPGPRCQGPDEGATLRGRTVAPAGRRPVVDLARNSERGAQVLCADGTIHSSTDDGATWPETGKVTSGLALDSKLVGSTVTAYVAWTKPGLRGGAGQHGRGREGRRPRVCSPGRCGAGKGGHRGVRQPGRMDGRRRVDLALVRRAEDLVQGLSRTAGPPFPTGTMRA